MHYFRRYFLKVPGAPSRTICKLIASLFFLFIYTFPVAVHSAPVDTLTALTVSKHLFLERSDDLSWGSDLSAGVVKTYKHNDTLLLYVVEVNHDRYAIISAYDAVYPVLSYGFTAYPRGQQFPPSYVSWRDQMGMQVLAAIRHQLTPPSAIQGEWSYYSDSSQASSAHTETVSPLITSTWSQGPPYNEQCPYSSTSVYSNNHVPVGCVAINMGQIMNYWQHPTIGTGSHSYMSNYGMETADFGNTTYDWANMPDIVTPSSPPAEKNAVAELLYHCGVSVDMMYGDNGSGAYSVDAMTALVTYFNYNGSSITYEAMDNHTASAWHAMLKNDLDNSRPVYYAGATASGSGHAFIVDGYQGSNNDHYHINWGWGASYNNYCYLNNLLPAGVQDDFSYNQRAIFGIQPDSYFQVNPQSITLSDSAQSSDQAVVVSNQSWTVNTPTAWLSVSPLWGSNVDTLVITATSANTSSSSRNGTVEVTSGGVTHTIFVSQAGAPSSGITEWFSPAEDLLNHWYNTTSAVSMYANPMVVDSAMITVSQASTDHIFTHHVGVICDPYSPFYPAHFSPSTSYFLDSIYIGGLYTVVNGSYTDTLIFEIVHNDAQTTPTFNSVMMPLGPDTLYFSPPSITGSTALFGWGARLSDPAKTVIKKPLTPNDSTNMYHYVDIGNLQIPAGHVVGVSVTFKPGYSYNLGDTLIDYQASTSYRNNFRYLLYATDNTTLNPHYFYEPYADLGHFNSSYSILTEGRYGTYALPFLNDIMYPNTHRGHIMGLKLQDDTLSLGVSPSSIVLSQDSGSFQSFSISSNASWTAVGSESWLDISPSADSGDAMVTVTALSANSSSSSRTAMVTITSGAMVETVVVTQEAAQLQVSPQSLSLAPAAQSGKGVSITSNVFWTVSTAASWLQLSPSSGSHNDSLLITATSANTGSSPRTAAVTVSGGGHSKTVNVVQQAPEMFITPQSITLTSSANASQTVTLNSNVSWTTTADDPWITVTPASGSNNSMLTIEATTANTDSVARNGTVTISGGGLSVNVSVTQEPTLFSLSLHQVILDNHDQATDSILLTANAPWSASTPVSWLHIDPLSGNSNTPIVFTALSANPDSAQRSAQVTFTSSGQTDTVEVVQAGSLLMAGKDTISLSAQAHASQQVAISANLAWIATANDSWLSVNPSSGQAHGNITITATSENPYPADRMGSVQLSGNNIMQTIIVFQNPWPDTTSVAEPGTDNPEIRIYPNPGMGEFTIYGENIDGGNLHIRITNLQGQKVMELDAAHHRPPLEQSVNASHLDAGIYFLEIHNGAASYRKKLIIY